MEISVEISKNYCQYIVLPPNSAPRGDLFSIPIHIISSIFTLLTVTHDRGLMCIKNNTLLINQQHPTGDRPDTTFRFLIFELRTLFHLVENHDFWKLILKYFVSFNYFSFNISMADERKLEGILTLLQLKSILHYLKFQRHKTSYIGNNWQPAFYIENHVDCTVSNKPLYQKGHS